MYRPKYATRPDLNHLILRDFLANLDGYNVHQDGAHKVYRALFRGWKVGAIDTKALGGFWLDWFVFVGDSDVVRTCFVEVKTPAAMRAPGHSLRPGEKWTMENIWVPSFIVSTDEDVQSLFILLCE